MLGIYLIPELGWSVTSLMYQLQGGYHSPQYLKMLSKVASSCEIKAQPLACECCSHTRAPSLFPVWGCRASRWLIAAGFVPEGSQKAEQRQPWRAGHEVGLVPYLMPWIILHHVAWEICKCEVGMPPPPPMPHPDVAGMPNVSCPFKPLHDNNPALCTQPPARLITCGDDSKY